MRKNPHAVALGRKGKGVPKQFSRAELEARRQRMVALNEKRKQNKESAQ